MATFRYHLVSTSAHILIFCHQSVVKYSSYQKGTRTVFIPTFPVFQDLAKQMCAKTSF
jgi:hypothetical protein